MIVLVAICLVGVSFETKAQMVLLVVLTVSIIDYWIGLCIPTNQFQNSRGATSMNGRHTDTA